MQTSPIAQPVELLMMILDAPTEDTSRAMSYLDSIASLVHGDELGSVAVDLSNPVAAVHTVMDRFSQVLYAHIALELGLLNRLSQELQRDRHEVLREILQASVDNLEGDGS